LTRTGIHFGGKRFKLPKAFFEVDEAVAKMQLAPQMKAKWAKCPKSEPFSVKET
jgi:hypothetical protein